MIVKKEYKFYAGHRNQDLQDKCRRPHGHDYKLFVYFNVQRNGSISTLFGDFDSKIEPMLKEQYDHRMFLDINDPLKPYLDAYQNDTGDNLGYNLLERASSVENVCYQLFSDIERFGFDVDKIELQETRTSTIVYTGVDYEADKEYFRTQ